MVTEMRMSLSSMTDLLDCVRKCARGKMCLRKCGKFYQRSEIARFQTEKYKSLNYRTSNYPQSQKEHTEIHVISKFDVSQASCD